MQREVTVRDLTGIITRSFAIGMGIDLKSSMKGQYSDYARNQYQVISLYTDSLLEASDIAFFFQEDFTRKNIEAKQEYETRATPTFFTEQDLENLQSLAQAPEQLIIQALEEAKPTLTRLVETYRRMMTDHKIIRKSSQVIRRAR